MKQLKASKGNLGFLIPPRGWLYLQKDDPIWQKAQIFSSLTKKKHTLTPHQFKINFSIWKKRFPYLNTWVASFEKPFGVVFSGLDSFFCWKIACEPKDNFEDVLPVFCLLRLASWWAIRWWVMSDDDDDDDDEVAGPWWVAYAQHTSNIEIFSQYVAVV